MTDVKPEFPDPPACPLLGLVADPATHYTFPHAGHRCQARRTSSTIDLAHQARYCLTSDFGQCDRYISGIARTPDVVMAAPAVAVKVGPMVSPSGTRPGGQAPSVGTTIAVDGPVAPTDVPAGPPEGATAPNEVPATTGDLSDEPAPRAAWTLYPPDPDNPGLVRPRAPRTWRQTSADPGWSESTAATPTRSVTARAVRLIRGIAVLAVLLLVLFVGAYLAAGSRLGLGGSGPSPSGSGAAAVAASAASTGLASAATSAAVASPAPARSAAASPAPSASPAPAHTPRTTSTVHVVRSGETLQGIATAYGVTVQQIVTANKLKNPNVIVAGERLVIPAPSKAP